MNLQHLITSIWIFIICSNLQAATGNVIEKQLQEIGTIPNEEVVVVQRKFTRKVMRHEITPISFGGIPFGTVRRTIVGGANYTIHINDWFAVEALNFTYTKTFFSSFTDDVNANKGSAAGGQNPGQTDIRPDFQKLLYFLTAGVQLTPFYGKVSSLSRWIAYIEPYFTVGAGLAKTEVDSYPTFYPGIGLRVFFKEWFSMRVEFRDYLYSEKFQTRTSPSVADTALRSNYAVLLSLSFWLPKMPS
jgi:outer membrane beta-barrel protein